MQDKNKFKEAMEEFHGSGQSAEDYVKFISHVKQLVSSPRFKFTDIMDIIEKVTQTTHK